MTNWQIEYFETQPGKPPVKESINKLELVVQTKVYNTLELLKEFGTQLGLPHCKKLTGTPLYELRIMGQNNIRIFYVAIVNQKFLLLHCFVKKSEKTPFDEVKTAVKRLETYKSNH